MAERVHESGRDQQQLGAGQGVVGTRRDSGFLLNGDAHGAGASSAERAQRPRDDEAVSSVTISYTVWLAATAVIWAWS